MLSLSCSLPFECNYMTIEEGLTFCAYIMMRLSALPISFGLDKDTWHSSAPHSQVSPGSPALQLVHQKKGLVLKRGLRKEVSSETALKTKQKAILHINIKAFVGHCITTPIQGFSFKVHFKKQFI